MPNNFVNLVTEWGLEMLTTAIEIDEKQEVVPSENFFQLYSSLVFLCALARIFFC